MCCRIVRVAQQHTHFASAGLGHPLLTILASPRQLRMNTRSPSTSTTIATLISNTVHASCRRGSARPVCSQLERPLSASPARARTGPAECRGFRCPADCTPRAPTPHGTKLQQTQPARLSQQQRSIARLIRGRACPPGKRTTAPRASYELTLRITARSLSRRPVHTRAQGTHRGSSVAAGPARS